MPRTAMPPGWGQTHHVESMASLVIAQLIKTPCTHMQTWLGAVRPQWTLNMYIYIYIHWNPFAFSLTLFLSPTHPHTHTPCAQSMEEMCGGWRNFFRCRSLKHCKHEYMYIHIYIYNVYMIPCAQSMAEPFGRRGRMSSWRSLNCCERGQLAGFRRGLVGAGRGSSISWPSHAFKKKPTEPNPYMRRSLVSGVTSRGSNNTTPFVEHTWMPLSQSISAVVCVYVRERECVHHYRFMLFVAQRAQQGREKEQKREWDTHESYWSFVSCVCPWASTCVHEQDVSETESSKTYDRLKFLGKTQLTDQSISRNLPWFIHAVETQGSGWSVHDELQQDLERAVAWKNKQPAAQFNLKCFW